MGSYSLCKAERLSGKINIASLFDNGKSFFVTPFSVFWAKKSEKIIYAYPSRFCVSVPKKRIKTAVKRNCIKRRSREAFRRNKQSLTSLIKTGEQIHLLIVYTSDKILPYEIIEKAMKKILRRIAHEYAEN